MFHIRSFRPREPSKASVIVSVFVLTLAMGGTAYAAIPSSSTQVITGCYQNFQGNLRVIDAQAGQRCLGFEKRLDWNKAGAKGDTGATGPTGPTGPQGPAGPAASQFGSNTQHAAVGTSAERCTIGEVLLTAGTISRGMPARGQTLPIGAFGALYDVLGTTYGGDGIKSFRLPDLTSAAPNDMTYSICVAGVLPSQH